MQLFIGVCGFVHKNRIFGKKRLKLCGDYFRVGQYVLGYGKRFTKFWKFSKSARPFPFC